MTSNSKKIDVRSADVVQNGFELFNMPPTRAAVESAGLRQILPMNEVRSDGPFLFRVFPDQGYLQLNKVFVMPEVSLEVLENGVWRPCTPVDGHCAPINLIAKTMFDGLKMRINGEEVYNSNGMNHYISWLETTLMHNESVKNEFYGAAGYTKSNQRALDETESGFAERRESFKDGEPFPLWGNLHFDLAHQHRYMLNQTPIEFELFRTPDRVCLQRMTGDKEWRLRVHSISLWVKIVNAYNAVNIGISDTLSRQQALYPHTTTECRSLFLSAGRMEAPENNLFTDKVPRRIICGLVPGECFSGSWGSQPFDFRNFDIYDIRVNAGGVYYPAVPFNFQFDKNRAVRGYADLLDSLGLSMTDRSSGITMNMWAQQGWCLFGFILTPDMEDGNDYDVIRSGTTSINIKFRKPIPAGGAQLIVYAEFNGLTTVDANRIPVTDGR